MTTVPLFDVPTGLPGRGVAVPGDQMAGSAPTTTRADLPLLTVIAHGTPRQQGSKKTLLHRTTGLPMSFDDNAPDLAVWRSTLAWAVGRAMSAAGHRQPLTGPLRVTAVFTLHRPKSAPKSRVWPSVKPDVDKYLRACLDAIKDGRGYADDALVVDAHAVKTYPGVHEFALSLPGVHLRIWAVS